MDFTKIGKYTFLAKTTIGLVYKKCKHHLVFACKYYSKTKFVKLPRITDDSPLLAFVHREGIPTFTQGIRPNDRLDKLYIGTCDITQSLFNNTRLKKEDVSFVSHILTSDPLSQIRMLRAYWIEHHGPKTIWHRQEDCHSDAHFLTSDSGSIPEKLEVELPPCSNKGIRDKTIDSESANCVPPPAVYHPKLPPLVDNWNVVVDEILSLSSGHAQRYNQLYRRVVLKRSGLPFGQELADLFNQELKELAVGCSFTNINERSPTSILSSEPQNHHASQRLINLTSSITQSISEDLPRHLDKIAKSHLESLSDKMFDIEFKIQNIVKAEIKQFQNRLFDRL